MRCLFGFMCVLALGVMPMVGCGETGDPGGNGGSAGVGGMGGGGTGGTDLCQGVDCDDGNECTEDLCADGMCEYAPIENGTACEESNECTLGMCASGACDVTPVQDGAACGDEAGTCQQGSCRMACDEQGIRDAIAAGGGPYTFDCDGPQTVVTAETIEIDNNVILDGEGKLTVDGDDDHRVLSVAESASAELRGVTVTRGFVDQHGSRGGAGILSLGSLTLVNSRVTGNNAESGDGGGIYYFGSVWTPRTITNSTVSGNSTTGHGGGIYGISLTLTNTTVSGNSSIGHGGGISSWRTTLTNSTVSGNISTRLLGGGIFSEHTTLTDSTVSGNSGGGIHSFRTTLTNSTVSGNIGRGIDAGSSGELLTLTNSTVSGNSDGSFRVTNLGDDGPEPVTVSLTNSTVLGDIIRSSYSDIFVANNTVFVGVCSPSGSISGSVLSLGYNIEGPGDTCGFDQETDQLNVSADDLKLAPLQDNGGPTETHAFGDGSVAIDVFPEAVCVDAYGEPLTTDQRGEPRPGDTMCDVGAFEVQP
jgi:hypothetical protein